MVKNPPISTKLTTTSHLQTDHKQIPTTYYVANPGHGLGQSQAYGGVKPVNGFRTLAPLDDWIFNGSPHRNKR